MEERFCTRENIEGRLVKDINSLEDVSNVILNNSAIQESNPESYVMDPRNGKAIIYNPSRLKRLSEKGNVEEKSKNENCIICDGKDKLPVFMTRDLDSRGYNGDPNLCFIGPNLFPHVGPQKVPCLDSPSKDSLQGAQYILWVSNQHTDIDEMSYDDNYLVLSTASDFMERLSKSKEQLFFQFVKNKGKVVGGSVVHGHYQGSALPFRSNRNLEDIRFEANNGESFANYILNENPNSFEIKDYGSVVSLVPCCAMKKPLDVLVLPKNTSKINLYDLDERELFELGAALTDITKAWSVMLPSIGKEFAYNLEFHLGNPGMYIEALPYTQETGGFENMDIYVCQSSPKLAAEFYKKTYDKLGLFK